jgi:hypothetical protein
MNWIADSDCPGLTKKQRDKSKRGVKWVLVELVSGRYY